jgi:hypothetical protein
LGIPGREKSAKVVLGFVTKIRSEPWFWLAVVIVVALAAGLIISDRLTRPDEAKLPMTETADEEDVGRKHRVIVKEPDIFRQNPDGTITPWPNPPRYLEDHVKNWWNGKITGSGD